MIEEQLDVLISMGVSNAFNCLMEVLCRFITDCTKITKRRKLKLWVKSLDENAQQAYYQYGRDRFLIRKFISEVSNTICQGNCKSRPSYSRWEAHAAAGHLFESETLEGKDLRPWTNDV